MSTSLFHLLIFLTTLLSLIAMAEWLHRGRQWPSEKSRKLVHVGGGLMCLFFPFYFDSHWWVLALAALSFLLLSITYWRNWLGSVHQTKRKSIGSVLFPLPVYGCFWLAAHTGNWLYYFIPISLLTLADTAAETGGQIWGHRTRSFFNGQKTLAGFISFVTVALPLIFLWLTLYHHYPPFPAAGIAIIVSMATGIAELVTLGGWDNLSIPSVAVILLYIWC